MSTKLPVVNANELIKILELKDLVFQDKAAAMRYMQIRIATK